MAVYHSTARTLAPNVQVSNSTATTQHLVKKSKRWVMEWILYSAWPNGEITEWGRSAQQNVGYLGWAYSQQTVAKMLLLADAQARGGDTELYDMVTTSGGLSTRTITGYSGAKNWGAGKSLKFVARKQLGYTVDEERKASLNCRSPSYPNDFQRDEQNGVRDTFVVLSNIYWKDTCTGSIRCLQSMYKRTAQGAIPYPSNASSGGTNPWGHSAGILPGVLFMYGQMEGKVNPYGGSNPTPSPTSTAIPPPTPTPVPTPVGPLACHLYQPQSVLPSGFGSPYDVAFSPATLHVKTLCDTSSVKIDLGTGSPNQYIYNTGYLSKNGAAWSAVNYTSTEQLVSTAWYPKTAAVSIPLTMQEQAAFPHSILGYICTWDGQTWKCGCRDQQCVQSYWQIQQFKR